MKIELQPDHAPRCAIGWETPSPTVTRVMSVHLCKLEPDHDGRHVCHCGAERVKDATD